jgi:hypothetical protein
LNLYFLLEGKTEKKVYPKLLEHLLPHLKKVQFANKVEENNYYLISVGGFPSLFNIALPNAIKEVDENGNFDYLILVLDTDNKSEIRERIEDAKKNTKLESNCRFHIVAQESCIETWFLGNRAIYPNTEEIKDDFSTYHQFYNVCQQDPELMLKPDNHVGSIANYHELYLKNILSIQGFNYSKIHPGRTTTNEYIEELESRINETPHLSSLRNFFNFCESISL